MIDFFKKQTKCSNFTKTYGSQVQWVQQCILIACLILGVFEQQNVCAPPIKSRKF